ncbi:MAG: caspase family protein, partial [Saprospiraceae bacterium]|nr:caspase family protein [Saprospiraceae bacterium]
ILDCCHAGSGSRNVDDFTLGTARQTSDRANPRALESLLNGYFTQKTDDLFLPAGKHILLAACSKWEKAYESKFQRGLFSWLLTNVLEQEQHAHGISYTQLFTEARLKSEQHACRQHPQFESYGYFNSLQGFLGLGSPDQKAPVKAVYKDKRWYVSMGALSGLSTDKLHPATFEILKNGEKVGAATTLHVGVDECNVEMSFDADIKTTFDARLISTPAPPMVFNLVAPKVLEEAALAALALYRPLYYTLQPSCDKAPYTLALQENELRILQASDQFALSTFEGNDWDAMFHQAFVRLEGMARWLKIMHLDNPGTLLMLRTGDPATPLKRDVECVLSELDDNKNVVFQHTGQEINIDILQDNGVETPVPFKLELRNNAARPRFCALLYGDENFRIVKAATIGEVPANSTQTVYEGTFDLKFKKADYSILKVLVSNHAIRPELLEQVAPMKKGETQKFWTSRNAGEPGIADNRDRGIADLTEDESLEQIDLHDWFAINLHIKCVGRQPGVGEKELLMAGNNIVVHKHPTFRAGVGLATVQSGNRAFDPMTTVSDLAHAAGLELFSLDSPSKNAAAPNMLVLTDLQHEESLLENPLKIEIAAGLQKNDDLEEWLLAFTFDGESLLPVGDTDRQDNGNALISIARLPDTEDKNRSLGRALKLCFLKLVLNKKDVRKLCWVDYSGEKPVYREDGLRIKVKNAQNILLCIHGIIGNTEGMAQAMRRAQSDKLVDLVLTFDFENLNTTIEETAGHLQRMLREEAGIDENSGKRVNILAHSMGGLVSRHFIETLRGNKVVKNLIMAGTPNDGSAISKIVTYRDYAIPLLTLLVNIPLGLPAAAMVLAVLKKSKDLTVTLGQMDEDADTVKLLGKSPDPHVQYSIIAGHLQRFLDGNTDSRKLMDKAYKLGGKIFYGSKPNDIAVSVASIGAIPKDRDPEARFMEIACHHLNYFEEPESVEAMLAALK